MLPNRLLMLALALLLAACTVNPMTPLPPTTAAQAVGLTVTDVAASPAPDQPTATPQALNGPQSTGPVTMPAAATPAEAVSSPPRPALTWPAATGAPQTSISSTTTLSATATPLLIVVAAVGLVPATAPSLVAPTAAAVKHYAPPAPVAVPALPPVGPPPSGDVAAAEQYTVDLINVRRAAAGIAPLAASATLMSVARGRVADMVARDYTGHNDPVTGEALGPAMMRAAGFGGPVGENWYGTRQGPPSTADVAMGWFMTDAPHYRNILGTNYSSVGVGIAFNGQQWLLVQDFAGN